jgi:hypothetical protein
MVRPTAITRAMDAANSTSGSSGIGDECWMLIAARQSECLALVLVLEKRK